MEYRSSNGGNHQQYDVVAGVSSSCGVQLSGGATAGVISAVGDSADIGLQLQGKGLGGVVIGATSTSSLTIVQRYVVQFTPAVLSSFANSNSTFTVTGLTTNSALFFTPRTNLSANYNIIPRCSTANELVLTFQNCFNTSIGSGESTNRGVLIQIG